MKILMTGGGTGGHVYPALAIAEIIKKHIPEAEIAFVGTKKGIENRLVPKEGYKLYHVEIQGISRSLSPKNIKTAYLILTSPSKARKIIEEFRPNVVIGTGGYVCWPLLRAAAKMGIPSMVHESNAYPGLAVKQVQKTVDVILTSFKETEEKLSCKEKIINTGNPLRLKYSLTDKKEARARLGISDSTRLTVLSFGGSLGAAAINKNALSLMEGFVSEHEDVTLLHASGSRYYEEFNNTLIEKGLDKKENIRVSDYIYDMPLYMAAADIVICRAGAMTLSELAIIGKPAILIPSPNVTDDHQYKNAKVIADGKGAYLVRENEDMYKNVENALTEVYESSDMLKDMSRAMTAFARPDAGERIYEEMMTLVTAKAKIVNNGHPAE